MHILTLILINFDHKLTQYNLILLDQDKHIDIFVLCKFGATDLININLSDFTLNLPFIFDFLFLVYMFRFFAVGYMFYIMMSARGKSIHSDITRNGLICPRFNDFFVGTHLYKILTVCNIVFLSINRLAYHILYYR